MASSHVVAKRYSRALCQLAQDSKTAREWLAPLESLTKTVHDSRELTELLKSPAFSEAEKTAVVVSLSEALKIPAPVLKFLRYLAHADRISSLEEIAQEYKKQVFALESSVEAYVESATDLSEAQTQQLKATLEKLAGKKVSVVLKTVPELLAGLKIQLLGKTIDASLMSSLDSMHRRLLKAEA